MRTCSHCHAVKPIAAFGKNRRIADGLHVWCRECCRDYDRSRRADPAVRARNAEYARQRRALPEVRARAKLTDAAWNARNPERRRELNNSAKKRAKDRERRQTPRGREMDKLVVERRRARKAQVDHSLTADEWAQIKERFNQRCAYCLQSGPLQMEHLRPIRLLGSHSVENVVPACRRCNQRKNGKDLLQFLAYAAEVYSA